MARDSASTPLPACLSQLTSLRLPPRLQKAPIKVLTRLEQLGALSTLSEAGVLSALEVRCGLSLRAWWVGVWGWRSVWCWRERARLHAVPTRQGPLEWQCVPRWQEARVQWVAQCVRALQSCTLCPTPCADTRVVHHVQESGTFSKLEAAGAFSAAEKLLPLADKLNVFGTLESLLQVNSALLVVGALALIGGGALGHLHCLSCRARKHAFCSQPRMCVTLACRELGRGRSDHRAAGRQRAVPRHPGRHGRGRRRGRSDPARGRLRVQRAAEHRLSSPARTRAAARSGKNLR